MKTDDGETIKKLLAEYVDIILIKSRITDPTGIEGDEGAIMLEDLIPTGRALPFRIETEDDEEPNNPKQCVRYPEEETLDNNNNNNNPHRNPPLEPTSIGNLIIRGILFFEENRLKFY